MKILRLLLLLIGAASLAACSRFTDFVIANTTNQPVRVVLRYKMAGGEPHSSALLPPEIIALSELARESAWRSLLPGEYEAAPDGSVLTLKLAATKGIKVARLVGFSRPDLEAWHDFPLSQIEIHSGRGVLRYCGATTLLAFSGKRDRQFLAFDASDSQLESGTCEGDA
jgi:hypothetical protein